MKALITGAGGFLGGHLVGFLEAQGVEVYSMSPRKLARPRHAVTGYADTEAQTTLLKSIRPDFVFHLAGILFAPNPVQVYEVNTVYAASLMAALKQADTPCRTLFVGTATEYGMIEPGDVPVSETLPCRPYDDYGISKLAQSRLALRAAAGGLDIRIARTFNILGPGLPEHFAATGFLNQLLAIKFQNAPAVIRTGNLATVRDFLHVRDVVHYFWKLMQVECSGEVVNVCSGKHTQIQQVLDGLIEAVGVEVNHEIDPSRMRKVDIPVHVGSPNRLCELTGEQPDFDLPSCLAEMVQTASASIH